MRFCGLFFFFFVYEKFIYTSLSVERRSWIGQRFERLKGKSVGQVRYIYIFITCNYKAVNFIIQPGDLFLAGIIIVNVAVPQLFIVLTNICPFVTRDEYSAPSSQT